MNRKCALPLTVAVVLALIPAGNVLAAPTEIVVPLTASSVNNQTAVLCTDCNPNVAYWHFVISPNNGDSEFVDLHLNLGGIEPYDTKVFVPNGSQLDNVFVEVPSGYTLESLIATGTSATIEWNGDTPRPKQFQLSGVVQPVPEPSTLLLLGSGLLGLGGFAWKRNRKV